MPAAEGEPEIKFFPPELFSDDGDGAVDNMSELDWEKAIQYHELKKKIHDEIKRTKIRKCAVRAILRKAQATVGAITRPHQLRAVPWEQSLHGELDLEHSLEESPTLDSLWVEIKEPRRAEVIVCLDTSLSMTGRKLAITAVALAVIALQLESEDLAIIAFESDANVVKPLGTRMSIEAIIEKFLEVPARGLTNIEAGLLAAQKESERGKLPKRAVILMSDGRFTAGSNPEYVAKKLPRLHVVQTGSPWTSPRFCRGLARAGNGSFVRVSRIEHLPKALYSLVHEIIR